MSGEAAWLPAGSALLCACVWAGFSALPASIRVATDGDVGVLTAWSFCAAIVVVPMLVAIAVLRGAHGGMCAFGGDGWQSRAIALSAWVVAMAGTLARLGAIMRAKTHHHALAGATFALVALGLGVAVALLCVRLSALLTTRTRRLVALACVAFAGLLVARELSAGLGSSDPLTRAWLIDLAAFGLSALFGALTPPLRSWPARLGPIALVVFIALGVHALGASELAPRLTEHAPLFASARAMLP